MWRVSKSSIRNSCVLIGAATATVAATATNRTPSFAPFSPYPRISLCEVEKSGLSKTKDSKSLDDCLNPACHSTMDLLKKFNMKTRKKKAPIVPTTNESEPNPYCTGCPADKDVQGRGTWQLIHSIASTYPQVPTEAEKRHMDNFLHSLSMVYPCPYCAKDFQERIVLFPPRLNSRDELMMWCCEFHNHVNIKLGKPVFPCSVAELDLRWKDGRDECWEVKHE